MSARERFLNELKEQLVHVTEAAEYDEIMKTIRYLEDKSREEVLA